MIKMKPFLVASVFLGYFICAAAGDTVTSFSRPNSGFVSCAHEATSVSYSVAVTDGSLEGVYLLTNEDYYKWSPEGKTYFNNSLTPYAYKPLSCIAADPLDDSKRIKQCSFGVDKPIKLPEIFNGTACLIIANTNTTHSANFTGRFEFRGDVINSGISGRYVDVVGFAISLIATCSIITAMTI
ncbi:hypothetical protein BDF19DRAFT_445540, partial [Syncephalis fuscata]